MQRRRNIWRSVVAGVLIGFAEGTRIPPRQVARPAGVVWLDDRRHPDPLGDVPVLLLDPIPVEAQVVRGLRKRVAGLLRLSRVSPLAWLWVGGEAAAALGEAGQRGSFGLSAGTRDSRRRFGW